MKNVQVMENDTYVDIDIEKTYTISASNFILIEGGGGANMFVDDKEIEAPVRIDCQVIIDYVTNYLKGNLTDKYSSVEGRITVI